ncbi:aldo/keto reductase [Novosphingopyxis sp.]|uniref:aldo/keto reductase n=1 Tax=Novosphingopyxis sp. TaxID=2709690 RepID=UPI003B5A56D4
MTTDTIANYPTIELNDGRSIPQLGFGTYQIEADGDAESAVRKAVDIGYRLVDTAAIYRNEKGVGAGLKDHDDIWLTTKVWNESQGYDRTLKAFGKCLDRLGRDSVDCVLIHWPCPGNDKYVETWKAFIEIQKAGKAKSIGVSNFLEPHLKRIVDETGVAPVLNQIELHPSFQQKEARKVHEAMGIATQSWSPLGQGDAMDNDVVNGLAEKLGRTPAQVVLRWHIDNGLLVIPKASSEEHMRDNFGVLDFELSPEDLAAFDALDSEDGRMGPDPATMNS